LFLGGPIDAVSASGSSAHDPAKDVLATGAVKGWKDPTLSKFDDSRCGVHNKDDDDGDDDDDDEDEDEDDNEVRSRSRSVFSVAIRENVGL
jgi:hypothetical protein